MSLKIKIVISIILISIAVNGIISYFFFEKQQDEFLDREKYKIEAQSQLLAEIAAPALYNFNIELINNMLDKFIISNKYIYEYSIFSADDAKEYTKKSPRVFNKDYLKRFEIPIQFKGNTIGQLKVIYSTRDAALTFANLKRNIQLLIVISLIILIVLQYIIISRFLKPISILTEASSNITKGRLNQTIDVNTKDEVGELARNFIKMRDSIQEQINNLATKNKNLENEVLKRKETEEELKKTKSYLDNVVNSMPSILLGMNTEGKIISINRKGEKELGSQEQHLIGNQVSDVYPYLEPVLEKIKESIRNRSNIIHDKISFMKNDNQKHSAVTAYPLVTNGVSGAIIRIDDITQKVRMEEMMIQTEKMLSVGGLAAGMAHEINNPLAGIMQNIQVLKKKLNPNLDRNIKIAKEMNVDLKKVNDFLIHRNVYDTMKYISESGEKAAKIVSNMLYFSRSSNKKLQAEDITKVIDAALYLAGHQYDLKHQFDFQQIKIIKNFSQNLPKVFCNKNEIEQVLLNLLRNAAEAMQEIKSHNYEPTITIDTKIEDSQFVCTVRDNGPGIPEKIRKKVFEPFFTTKDMKSGTGLGLSVSYFIVTENHNGQLECQSNGVSGTSFILTLPLA